MYDGNPGEIDFGSSYRGSNYSKCMTEIQGKSILVRVSARFELARVRVIGSRLYNKIPKSDWPSAVLISAPVNLRNRTGEERRQHTLWDERYNNFVLQNFSPNFTPF